MVKGMRWNIKTEESKARHEEHRRIAGEKSRIAYEKFLEEQKIKKEEEKQRKESLALLMLLGSIGNEEDMNKSCDIIKDLGLVENYK